MDERLRRAMHLYAFFGLGVFLLAVPWSPIWDRIALGLLATPVGAWTFGGPTRGVISALGLLDLLVAAADARALWLLSRRVSS